MKNISWYSRLVLILAVQTANFTFAYGQVPWNEGLGVKYAYYKARLYDTLLLSATRFTELAIPSNLTYGTYTQSRNFGYDIPAGNRDLDYCIVGQDFSPDICNLLNNGTFQYGYSWNANIKFGDATTYLGQLTATVALEYELRRRANQDYGRTLFELWKLLETYRRLDIYADFFYAPGGEGCSTPPSYMNGFFMRDDVEPRVYSQNMFAKKAEGTFAAPVIQTSIASDFMSDVTNGYERTFIINSNWGTRDIRTKDEANEPSYDQIAYLMMGFAFTAKFLPNYPIEVWDNHGNRIYYNFHDNAKRMADAIMARMAKDNYQMRLPCTGEIGHHFGFFSLFNSFGLQQAGRVITGRSYYDYRGNRQIPTLTYPIWQIMAYPDNIVWNADKSEEIRSVIKLINDTYNFFTGNGAIVPKIPEYNPFFVNKYNRSLVLTLAALGNSWHEPGAQTVIGLFLQRLGIKIKDFPKQNTMDPLNRLGIRWNNPYHAYVHACFHNGHGRLSNQLRQMALQYLALASCHTFDRYLFPAYQNKNCGTDYVEFREHQPFSTDNLMIYSYRVGSSPEELNCSRGKFNGIDFLLLHNLFLYDEVVRNQSTYLASTGYRNYYQHLFQENKPNYNSPQPQYNYHSVHDMFVKNSSVGNNNTLFFRADDEIIVSETDFQPGSYVVLESKPYDCGGIFGTEVYKQMDYSEELDSVKADMARYDSVLAFWDDVRAQVNNDSLFTQLMIQAYQESYNQQLAELEGGSQATEQPFDLTVYPSPTRDKVNITLPPYAGSLKVQDALGRTHVTQTLTPTEGDGQITHTLDLKQLGLSNGLYFVCFTTTHQQGCARFVYQP